MQASRRRFWDFLLLVAFVLPVMLGGFWLIGLWRLLGCPPGTFLSGPLHQWLEEAGLIVATLALYFLARGAAIRRLPALGRLVDDQASYPRARKWRRTVTTLCAAVFLLALAGLAATESSTFCLTDHGISYRAQPWSAERRYAWIDVAAISTYCHRGYRGRAYHSFVLSLKDGQAIDVANSGRDFPGAYPAIVQALDGVPFAFDARLVEADCGYEFLPMLQRRP